MLSILSRTAPFVLHLQRRHVKKDMRLRASDELLQLARTPHKDMLSLFFARPHWILPAFGPIRTDQCDWDQSTTAA